MISKKIIKLDDARQKKRGKTGWSLAEIEQRAIQEREAYKKLAQHEPDNLVSGGDMSNIAQESENE
jgi:hypothetical protein